MPHSNYAIYCCKPNFLGIQKDKKHHENELKHPVSEQVKY